MDRVKRLFAALWAGWKRFAHAVGVVNRIVFLTLFYFLIVNLTNLILRLFRIDLLDRRPSPAETYWHGKDHRSGAYRNQF